MKTFDDLSNIKVDSSELLNKADSNIFYTDNDQIQRADQLICELRDLLTFIKGYKQLIDHTHPETISFLHWTDINTDIEAMADRLTLYEREIHTTKKNEVA